jgi:hypothetical protein
VFVLATAPNTTTGINGTKKTKKIKQNKETISLYAALLCQRCQANDFWAGGLTNHLVGLYHLLVWCFAVLLECDFFVKERPMDNIAERMARQSDSRRRSCIWCAGCSHHGSVPNATRTRETVINN